MVLKHFRLRSPTPSSLESISCPALRPLTTLPFIPRSTLPNTVSPLSPAIIGGLVVIGILALLCAVGVGLALHVHYCRQSNCSVCSAIVFFRRSGSHSTQAHDHVPTHPETQRDVYLETPRDRIYSFGPSIQGGQMSSPKSLPSLTPPPMLRTRGPQNPEMAMPNHVVSVRDFVTPSVTSNNCAPTSRVSEVPHSYPSPPKFPIPLERTAIHSDRTLDRNSNLSEEISIITLPSFVEHERHNSIPSPILVPPNLAMVEGMRSLPSPRQPPSFQSSRSRSRVTNTVEPITSSSETHLMYDFPSPSSVPHRQSHLPHRTRPLSSRRAGVRHELATAKLKPVAQAEAVKIVRPGTPEASKELRANHLPRDALSPLTIPTYTSLCGRRPSCVEPDAGVVFRDSPRLTSPREVSPVSAGLEGASPTHPMDNTTEPSPSYQSPVLNFPNSPSSYSSPDEKRSPAISQARSSMSTVPSVSAFPSPPDFPPGHRDKTLSFLSNRLTSGRPFPPVTLWENTSTRGVETASPNEGEVSTPLLNADAPRPMPTINSCSALSKHPHAEFTGGGGMSVRSTVSSRISPMRRLSRIPLGPRQMSGGPTSPQRWTSQPLSR
ncbi:hypothetical protein BDM02DRAFT_1049103 [Thelephora ganbajun]|uniref:Uncharacterized protein n=1 Tax=Thelephora ganbajun TaxID=370292 RepID=A0ACB6Z4L7_THEGA|nr:hypothetical protein BDM02DRAFT_1049103 [Thelephora ganbajun]